MVVHTQPALSPGLSARVIEAMVLSPPSFPDTETESDESKDEGTDSESREATSEDQQHQAVRAKDTAEDEPLGLGYGAAKRRALELAEGTMPSTYEVKWSFRSTPDQQIANETPIPKLPIRTTWEDPKDVQSPVSPEWSPKPLSNSPVILSPVASPVPVATVDEDDFLEIGAQLELHRSILHDHTESLDALLPTLFKRYNRDFIELFSRSGAIQ
ncbi:hypothetical protein Tco_1231312 [Tanacetum coccineum]